MYDPKDCAKYIAGQTSHSTQDTEVRDWSTTDYKISIKITNGKKISDFWGIRR